MKGKIDMKTFEEIKGSGKVIVINHSTDGGAGRIFIHRWEGSVIWSNGGGWEHISVCPFKRNYIPSWDDMCAIKDIFFYDDEWAVQFHPAKTEYVNNMPNCLHLWKPTKEKMPIPPSILTGIKDGQTKADVIKAIKELDNEN